MLALQPLLPVRFRVRACVRGVLQASIYALVSACHDHEVDSSCCPVDLGIHLHYLPNSPSLWKA